jgi:hypothetical protein
MDNLQVTEYSAIALLFLIAMIGARLGWKWLEGYNERAKVRDEQDHERREQDYQDRLRLSDAMVELVAKDIEAKVQMTETLRTMKDETKAANAAIGKTLQQVCKTLTDLSREHRRSREPAKKETQ